MAHYVPWPIGIRGGALGINYDGNVYLLADGRLILQSGGGLSLSSTSDITMSGGAINMTGGSINLTSGANHIYLDPAGVDITGIDTTLDGGALNLNSSTIKMSEGHIYAKLEHAGDQTWYFGTLTGEDSGVNNPGFGIQFLNYDNPTARGIGGALGGIGYDGQWWGWLSVIPPGDDTNTDPAEVFLNSTGNVVLAPGWPVGYIGLGLSDGADVRIGGYSVWSDYTHHNLGAAGLPKVASANSRNSYNTSVQISNATDYQRLCKVIKFTEGIKGTVRVYNVVRTVNNGATTADLWSIVKGYSLPLDRGYYNKAPIGTQRFNQCPAGQTQTYTHWEDLTVDLKVGEGLCVMANAPAVSGSVSYQDQFYVCYDNGDLITCASTNATS